MQFKRILRSALLAGMAFLFTGCGVSRIEPDETTAASSETTAATTVATTAAETYFPLPSFTEGVELLPDPRREDGLYIRSQDGTLPLSERNKGIFLPSGTPPSWAVAQWNSGPCLWDERTIDGRTITDGQTKWATFGENGEMTLRINTVPYYNGSPVSLADPWPHLLVESESFEVSPLGLGDAESLVVSMDVRLKDSLLTPIEGDEVVAAQLLCYLYVTEPSGTDFVWFGLQLFDSRGGQSSYLNLDEGSGRMIYSLSTSDTYSGGKYPTVRRSDHSPRNDDWFHVEVDLLPHLKNLVAAGIENGFFSRITSLDDICFSGTNIGWEIHGSYDITAEIANYSLRLVR